MVDRTDRMPGDGDELSFAALPASVVEVLGRLDGAGHEAVLVGGTVRDALRGRVPAGDWDVATSALPDAVAALFPGGSWENRFGTVTVRGTPSVEITSYRTEAGYRDRRRPDEVRFGASLPDDLARRDFTVNAVAWRPTDLGAGVGRLVDPHGGTADLAGGVLRAVGDADERLAEDALRLLRAVRFAHGLGLTLEPATAAAVRRQAPRAASVSGERLRAELLRILDAPAPPSAAFRLMEELGLLAVLLPEVAALRGIPQAKRVPGDALDHTLAAVDAADPAVPLSRVAVLLHDVGKSTTMADGHFIGHETVGAELAAAVLARLRFSRAEVRAVVHAVRHHMANYRAEWTDAAVRRFVRRVGAGQLPLVLAVIRADDRASGVALDADGRAPLEARIAALDVEPARVGELAVDGDDLVRELGIRPGPEIGRLLEALREAILDDPAANQADRLLAHARRLHAER